MFINAHQHFYLRCLQVDNRQIAAQQSSIELVLADITPLARLLPIVIPATWGGALPLALVSPSDTHDPFQGHTPRAWRDHPFHLAAHSLAIDAEGKPTTADVIWADPNAPHLNQTPAAGGYRLFGEDGEPSSFLKGVVQRLRQLQQEVERTQALVALLERAEGLERKAIHHRGSDFNVYRIITEGLGERLEALDPLLAGQAMVMADAIAESQRNLTFLRPKYDYPPLNDSL